MTNQIPTVCRMESLRKRADFLRLRKGRRYSSGLFTLQAAPALAVEGKPRVNLCRTGYTVTTKLGNAPIRNRIKRRLRAASKLVVPYNGHPGYDYVLIARRRALDIEFAAIVQEMKLALDHVHGNKAKGRK